MSVEPSGRTRARVRAGSGVALDVGRGYASDALLRWNRALIGAAVAARAGVPDAATAKPRRRHASRWNSAVFAGGSCSHRAPPPVVSCSHENPDNPKCLGLTFPVDPKMLWPAGYPS